MELNNYTDTTVQVTQEEEVPIDFSIDEESLGILFKGFSDGLYSNKIGSIVREITSNCFDSHIEANQSRAVTIDMITPDAYSATPGSISFIDYGIGLSPDRIKNIYSKYFASTKRATNSQIGGFGIGAKSPLSYTESFMVITRYEGTEYIYIIHRGLKVPQIQLVEKTPTNKHNGTEVKIPIKTRNEFETFQREVKNQLQFFDNIDYINCGVDNNYKLYQGKHFILRYEKQTEFNYQEPSICLGKVRYPIDWYQLDLYKNDFNSPISLRFDIGDLSVTMNRETLEYTPKAKEAINQKFIDAKKELEEISGKAIEVIKDFDKFIELSRERSIILRLTEDDFVSARGFIAEKKVKYIDFVNFPESFKFPASNPFFEYVIPGLISSKGTLKSGGNGRRKYRGELLFMDILKKNTPIYRVNGALGKRKNMYLHSLDGDFFVIRKSNEDSNICAKLGLAWEKDADECIKQYSKTILKYLIDHTKSYDRTDIDEQWLTDYLKDLKDYQGGNGNSNQIIKDKSEFIYRDLHMLNGYANFEYREAKIPFNTFTDQLQFGQMVIYGGIADNDSLIQIGILLQHIKTLKCKDDWGVDTKKVLIIKISKENFKQIKLFPGAIHVNTAIQRFHKQISMIKLYGDFKETFPDSQIFDNILVPYFPRVAKLYLQIKNASEDKLVQINPIALSTANAIISTEGYHYGVTESINNLNTLKKWLAPVTMFTFLNYHMLNYGSEEQKELFKSSIQKYARINSKSILNY